MKKIVSLVLAVIMIVGMIPLSVSAAGMTELPTAPNTMLTGGKTYVVSKNTTIKGAPGQSALVVSGNVTIRIKKGVTLTVTGGAADGIIGAGAGIEVPKNSSLTVCGAGTLNATGGSAAAGEKGENGANSSADYYWCQSGKGGNGGNGGGGAGAGIGGKGGNGGLGGAGGAGLKLPTNKTDCSGNNGENGQSGSPGEACGNISVCRSVIMKITRGQASLIPSEGGSYGNDKSYTYTNTYYTFGGGGGGAGGNGYSAYDIGSGGAGGGGGGGGGSGLVIYSFSSYFTRGGGDGGNGGFGVVNGRNGYDDGYEYNEYGIVDGNGGNGGSAGGGAGEKKEVEYYYETVAIPTANKDLEYTGNAQTGIPLPADFGEFYTVSGSTSAKDAGSYTVDFILGTGFRWDDGTFEKKTITWSIERQPIKIPSEASFDYTGSPVNVFMDASLYTVNYTDGKQTKPGNYSVTLTLKDKNNFVWDDETTDDKVIKYNIHKYTDDNNDGTCDVENCNGTDCYYYDVSYLDREIKDDNTVSTTLGMFDILPGITKGDTVWGDEKTTEKVWYAVGKTVDLSESLTVKGNVAIILLNGAELKVNKGITVEEGGSISFYAQTDDGDKMGKLTAVTGDATVIGGVNGGEGAAGHGGGPFDYSDGNGGGGGAGGNINGVYFYGGNILFKSTGVCIGAGNGGTGGSGSKYGIAGGGGAGGNVREVCFCGGIISLESTGSCICGGSGGSGGYSNASNPGDGGCGGSVNVHFYGGKNLLKSSDAACIRGGTGGSGGTGKTFSVGSTGSPGQFTLKVSGKPGIKAGSSKSDAGEIDFNKYENQKYLSVCYHTWEYLDSTSHKCTRCGEIVKHTDNGNGICTVCGGRVIITVPGKAPNCEEPGYSDYYKCGTKYYKDKNCTQEINNIDNWKKTDGYLKALGHTPSDKWTVVFDATCTDDGYELLKCEVCGETIKKRSIPAGHTYSEDWSYDENYHWHTATCGHDSITDKAEHTLVNGICSVCGYECETNSNESVNSQQGTDNNSSNGNQQGTDNNSSNGNQQGTDNNSSVNNSEQQNGEPTTAAGSVLSQGNIWIIVAVAVVAIGGVAALVIIKKKKKPAASNE